MGHIKTFLVIPPPPILSCLITGQIGSLDTDTNTQTHTLCIIVLVVWFISKEVVNLDVMEPGHPIDDGINVKPKNTFMLSWMRMLTSLR